MGVLSKEMFGEGDVRSKVLSYAAAGVDRRAMGIDTQRAFVPSYFKGA